MVWECIQSVLKPGLLALLGSKVLQTGLQPVSLPHKAGPELQPSQPIRRVVQELVKSWVVWATWTASQPYMAVSRIIVPRLA